jgi:hypothetical protein
LLFWSKGALSCVTTQPIKLMDWKDRWHVIH